MNNNKKVFLLVLSVIAVAGIIYTITKYGRFDWFDRVVHEKTPAHWFVVAMALLPNVGLPISVFLVLAGAKFGLVGGLLAAFVTMPTHLLFSFFAVHSVFRPTLVKLLHKMDYHLPEIPQKRIAPFAVLFVGVPGLPYAVKNYGLALTGIPFRYYFGISLPINLLLSVPVIGLGASAIEMNLRLFFLFAAVLVIGYVIILWMKRNIGNPAS
jgi:uncharacterized membrane protein YdjX (TVP38/TMEM64 family)